MSGSIITKYSVSQLSIVGEWYIRRGCPREFLARVAMMTFAIFYSVPIDARTSGYGRYCSIFLIVLFFTIRRFILRSFSDAKGLFATIKILTDFTFPLPAPMCTIPDAYYAWCLAKFWMRNAHCYRKGIPHTAQYLFKQQKQTTSTGCNKICY